MITEWKADAADLSVANPASRREVLRIGQPQSNHNGGALAFSPVDGRLYISLGDGGAANDVGPGHSVPLGNGQGTTNVLGDILRIDPLAPSATPGSTDPAAANGNSRIPADNPFVGATPGADEIYASGFRNPFRFSFDAANGRLVVGDVGQNNNGEIDVVSLGGNHGWHVKEGSFLFDPATGGVSSGPVAVPGLIDPVLQYDHDEGSSIIGGFVYRGTALPGLVGQCIFGDLSGRLFEGDLATGQVLELRLGPDDRALGRAIVGFGEDADHELYVLATDFSGPGGLVQRIVAVPEPASLVTWATGEAGPGARPGATPQGIPPGPGLSC